MKKMMTKVVVGAVLVNALAANFAFADATKEIDAAEFKLIGQQIKSELNNEKDQERLKGFSGAGFAVLGENMEYTELQAEEEFDKDGNLKEFDAEDIDSEKLIGIKNMEVPKNFIVKGSGTVKGAVSDEDSIEKHSKK